MLILLADIFFKLRRAYAALYCGPIVIQSFFDKINLMYEKLRETTNLCVEILNSWRQTKGNFVTWYKFAFSV